MARMRTRTRTRERIASGLEARRTLAGRLREFRKAKFGDQGGPEMARLLGLPARTYYNYETGVTIPAEVLLALVDRTDVSPIWLLAGEGPMTRSGS
ncbi:helix-turn-helix domain-containing protein [Tautonia plasticadhaerens]|uniref:HTH cro/C1-type domain-containing protein n=1 Tax=Tautonia plasticadhaerens TaxID=2527974 RepID=A0A518GWV1_9BACT|nr:helix-turn-helix transcriptional regulator [Tautonia plasticadhaerens]QDV33074.1 hypothetical protein ElP_09160 [Tautonia plasticadhaerens]